MSSNFSIMRFGGDHMIFQSGRKNTIFGHAPTSEKVTLKIIGITEAVLSSVSDENGRWEIEIPEYPSSFNAFALEFSCKDEVITFDDVLFGELYHISGQSNMELQIKRTIDSHYLNHNSFACVFSLCRFLQQFSVHRIFQAELDMKSIRAFFTRTRKLC